MAKKRSRLYRARPLIELITLVDRYAYLNQNYLWEEATCLRVKNFDHVLVTLNIQQTKVNGIHQTYSPFHRFMILAIQFWHFIGRDSLPFRANPPFAPASGWTRLNGDLYFVNLGPLNIEQ